MRLLTCGSRLEIPSNIMSRFDGVVSGYHWDLWNSDPNKNIKTVAQKYSKTEVWSNFLYGNRYQSPDPSSGAATMEEWVYNRVFRNPHITHWTLINEFINDKDNYNPYPNYSTEDIRKYLWSAKRANPNAKFIIADFRPYQLERWERIKIIAEDLLTSGAPLDGVGIQVHFKTSNAHSSIPLVPYMLDALPTVISSFDGVCPTHIIEASGWRSYKEPVSKLTPLWVELLAIAVQGNCETFCPWWLNQHDEGYPKPMPSFEGFVGAGIYSKDWNQLLLLPD